MITRRALTLAGLSGIAQGLLRVPAHGSFSRRVPEYYQEQFVDIFRFKSSALAIGNLYLQSNPGEASVDLLVTRLIAAIVPSDDELDAAGVRNNVNSVRKNDFDGGRVTWIHGWLLSVTEVRLCALAALSHDSGD